MSGQNWGASLPVTTRPALPHNLAIRSFGALLCVAISVIHSIDQEGFPGSKDPAYVGILYYILEFAGIVTALLLIAGFARAGWLLSLGVSAGPLVGYVLSRGPGLPDYDEDVGNWAEPLGIVSLAVEAVLLVLAITMLNGLFPRDSARSPGH